MQSEWLCVSSEWYATSDDTTNDYEPTYHWEWL